LVFRENEIEVFSVLNSSALRVEKVKELQERKCLGDVFSKMMEEREMVVENEIEEGFLQLGGTYAAIPAISSHS